MPSPIFAEAVAGACIFLGDVERFPKAEVVLEGEFVFAGHGFQDGRFFPVDREIAGLFVGGDARVAPLAFFHRFAMFLAAGNYFSRSLADIFFSAWASKHVDSFLLVWVFLSPAVGTEDAFQLATTFEGHVKASFLGRAFEGVRDGWNVWEADEGFLFNLKNFFVGKRLR